MKILMYGWEFPPRISGGLGVACHAIVQELARKKLDVTVVLPYAINNFMDRERITFVGCDAVLAKIGSNPGFEYLQEIYTNGNFTRFLNPYLHLNETEYLAQLDKASNKVSAIIAKLRAIHNFSDLKELASLHTSEVLKLSGDYGFNLLADVCRYAVVAGALATIIPHDVIHAHDWLTVLAGIEAKKHSGKPLVFHVHALEPDRSGTMIDTRIFAIEKYGMTQADKVVAVSEYTKNTIISHYGIPPEKIVVVHNGAMVVDDAIKHSITGDKHHKMVLFLGRLVHQKGPFFYIDAARKILEKRRDVHFVVAGTGDLLREMIDRVAALRLGKYIHFTGFLDHEKISRIFRFADVYVMPSVSEPFGISCLEALSYGVPVVISKQSGVSEVLSHVSKVDFWDVDEMANKILALLDHPALRKVTIEHSNEELKKLTWGKTADSLIALYTSLFK